MQYVKLGQTNIEVSRLCFGGLIIGPLQVNLSKEEGAKVILSALERGVNFIDTAELYGTYPHIREALKHWKKDVVISTKCYAYTREDAVKSVEKARKELDRDVIDIFSMHEQESALTLRGHRDAYEYYLEAREKGIIRAVGVSTHNVKVVDTAAGMDGIDVIHPLVNKSGIGIGDGTIEDMLRAVEKAYNAGKGIYSMKALGGGNLLGSYEDSLNFVLNLPFIHAVAVGMQSVDEVKMNVSVFTDEPVDENVRKNLAKRRRHLHIDYWCEGCGRCVERCKQNALSIVDKKATVNPDKCTLCSYCAGVCPQFAIKVQ